MAQAKRKLAAILSADVVGYSRLMGADERATLETLDTCRAVFAGNIKNHDGRLVDTAGDSVLAVFDSVVEAVQCAIAVQTEIGDRNVALAEARRMRFRIGVNLGDVIAKDDGTIYGDGVNVAARLESLAEPGAVTISEDAYRQVDGKTDLAFQDLGEHDVKNIDRPVRAYRVIAETTTPIAAKAQAPPDKPSIAVLPFTNMSGDPEQEYFADGITEDPITGLSRLRNLTVIARHSVFTYKGKPADLRQVGRDLGVRHVLEGSVRKAGNRVRITAQLIDCANGDHVWAERYDRELDDLFDLQDEITGTIVTELDVKLVEGEDARMRRSSTSDTVAYDWFLRAQQPFNEFSKQGLAAARESLHKALEIDPRFAAAWVGLGWSHLHDHIACWSDDPAASLKLAEDAAQQAVAADPGFGELYGLQGAILFSRREAEPAIAALEKGVALHPNDSLCIALLGMYSSMAGRPEKALALVEQALSLNPHPPPWYFQALGYAYLFSGRTGDAISSLRQCVEQIPEFLPARVGLVFAFLMNGQEAEAEAQVRDIIRISPNFDFGKYAVRRSPDISAAFERIAAKIGIE
ncbi:MAG: adenylate/guanylate cyclase domain-containing protein [Alphaproteobacteria bacterium]|nr:adenylate/guanylate cyclase domain-containing protein [Alphaproteobacteria bacterium]